jgi:hypothetical protein
MYANCNAFESLENNGSSREKHSKTPIVRSRHQFFDSAMGNNFHGNSIHDALEIFMFFNRIRKNVLSFYSTVLSLLFNISCRPDICYCCC